MATSLASLLSSGAIARERDRRERWLAVGMITTLTLLAVAVHGYHPYAEDGGVYLPEIKRLLRPELYPQDSAFVVGHLRLSLFAPLMAALVRWSRQPLETVLLFAHLASFWATLFIAWLLVARCYSARIARAGAVTLLAVWLNLPVAGTSLMLMDPYVTARSFSTPLVLLALVGALDLLLVSKTIRQEYPGFSDSGLEPAEFEHWHLEQQNSKRHRGLVLCSIAIAGAAAMHPLMAAYGFGAVLMLGCVMSSGKRKRVTGTLVLCATALAVAGAVQLASVAESEAYRMVVLSRQYWFLSQWHWYELFGLAAPLFILASVALRRDEPDRTIAARTGLARMALMVGVTAILVAVLFARISLTTHLVARLQPLRIFQLVYVVMILIVGATLAERWLRRSAIRWMLTFSVLAGIMFFAERQTFPASPHLELPGTIAGRGSTNPWERAFVWISRNTPEAALFALDPHYITSPGEDAQEFRAIAERNALPDYSKDGGVASIDPALAAEWMAAQKAQINLNAETDAVRMKVLRPTGATWVVLDRRADTGFRCDYANSVVKVCRLP